MTLSEAKRLSIGRLGTYLFPGGLYVYLGSAHGPGGLRGRLAHHFRRSERPHWHIDYLRAVADISGGWVQVEDEAIGDMPLECLWSQEFANRPGAVIPVAGFGASDCRCGCPAHLIWLGRI